MVNVEPYEYQKKTNLKEHNDLVAKINEIVDVINNNNLDTILPKISKLETDVSTIKATDSLQWTDIENLKDSQSAQDVTIGNLDTQVKGVTESLVSGIAIIDGITTGNMKVRVEREKATPIDSNDYNIQKPVSMELIQGSGPSTFKAQITLSDGTIIRSDDFMFTTEAIGTDVYISSFVFKNGNVAGTISADIGLSNGTTIEANNFAVPMDPSLLNTVQDLSTRLSAVEGGSISGLDELKATVESHTTSINQLDTNVADLQISKVDIAQGANNAGKVLGINESGDVAPITIESGSKPILAYVSMKVNDYFTYTPTTVNKSYGEFATSLEYVYPSLEGNGGRVPSDCIYNRIYILGSTTGSVSTNVPTDYTNAYLFVKDLFNKLNIDVSKMGTTLLQVTLVSTTSRANNLSATGGGNITLRVVNGEIIGQSGTPSLYLGNLLDDGYGFFGVSKISRG